MRRVLVIVTCLIAAACSASGPGPRALESRFENRAGVADPYADGKRHLAAGRYDLAAQRFGQALANDRRSIDALNGLAIAYSRLGRFEIAQTHFERALQLDATRASTLNNYGWSLLEEGRLRDAKPFLELALRHATDAEAAVVAANIDVIRRPRSSTLIGALKEDSPPGAVSGYRLVRVAASAYRLETSAGPAGVGAAGSAPRSAERLRVAEPDLDSVADVPVGDARIESEPVSESEAAELLAGDQR